MLHYLSFSAVSRYSIGVTGFIIAHKLIRDGCGHDRMVDTPKYLTRAEGALRLVTTILESKRTYYTGGRQVDLWIQRTRPEEGGRGRVFLHV